MRDFLLTACPVLLWVITAVQLVFLVFFFPKYKKTGNILYLLSGLITFGLFYDALMLALGGVLQEGPVFQFFSQARFISHGALIPLIFLICAYALNLKGLWLKIVWAFTSILVVLGIAEGFATQLVVKDVANIIRYASGDGTPGWAEAVSGILSYGTVIPLMIVGIVVWMKQKTPKLFLSGFLMFAFSALGPATGNFDLIFFISMFGEVLMALFFYLYAEHNQKNS